MKYEPLISIIMPVYNGSNYMRQAIDSALAQTYKNFEVVVVNDGSSDEGETERIALSYGAKIHFINRKENRGIAYTLNEGISNMRGDYFTWLSHDDLYEREKLEEQVIFLNSILSSHPELIRKHIMLSGGTGRIDKDGNEIGSYNSNPNGHKVVRTKRELLYDNIKRYGISGCTVLIPREAFEECGGFDEEAVTVQDTQMWYRLILNGYIFCFLDKPLVMTRIHAQKTGTRLKDKFEVEKENLQDWLIKQMILDDELNNVSYLTDICVNLEKMNYKKAPKTIKYYIKTKHRTHYLTHFLPKYVYGWLYGNMRNIAKICYWEAVKHRECK